MKDIAQMLYQIKGTSKIQNRSKNVSSKGIGKGHGTKFLVWPHKKYIWRCLFCYLCRVYCLAFYTGKPQHEIRAQQNEETEKKFPQLIIRKGVIPRYGLSKTCQLIGLCMIRSHGTKREVQSKATRSSPPWPGPTVQLASRHVWFCTKWPDRVKGQFNNMYWFYWFYL